MPTDPDESSPASPTVFEYKLSDAADEILDRGNTGYNWQSVDALLQLELKDTLPNNAQTRCKKAGGSGRAANVLTESNDKDIDLYLIFIVAPYTSEKFVKAAIDRVERFASMKTVAVAERDSNDVWRVVAAVEREGIGVAENLRAHFPVLTTASIHVVKGADSPKSLGANIASADVDEFEAAAMSIVRSVEGLDGLTARFRGFGAAAGVEIDSSTAIDLLATALSSQLLLFAGPSGTGKSTLARACAEFLSAEATVAIVDARRGWLSSEDLVGYYSNLAERFAQTSDTATLIDLHEACTAHLLGENADLAAPAPVLLVEEMNLSSIEGYLSWIVHGLSTPSSAYIRWGLHAQRGGALDSDELLQFPSELLIGPWPRIFGTINVDSNSPAPARKVSARGSVILVEPQEQLDIAELVETIVREGKQEMPIRTPEPTWMGDPKSASASLSQADLTDLVTAFKTILDDAFGDNDLVPSRRELVRAINYMAYFVLLAGWEAESKSVVSRLAAENAFMHVVLPQLSSDRFRQALSSLDPQKLVVVSDSPDVFGGLLATRLERLKEQSSAGLFADTVDFWTALS